MSFLGREKKERQQVFDRKRITLSSTLAVDQEQTTIPGIKEQKDHMGAEEDTSRWPPWLKPLLEAKFFVQCKFHADSHKSECNMYCLDCINGAICFVCRHDYHTDHRAIQVRRSSYHDVVRVSEIQKFLDISGVQTYIINSARVVFINERPQPRPPGRGVTNTCEVCERSLLDSFRFCSLGCKVEGTSRNGRSKKKTAAVAAAPMSSDSEASWTSNSNTQMSFTPSTPPPTTISFRTAKRRKGIPHRAPFGNERIIN